MENKITVPDFVPTKTMVLCDKSIVLIFNEFTIFLFNKTYWKSAKHKINLPAKSAEQVVNEINILLKIEENG